MSKLKLEDLSSTNMEFEFCNWRNDGVTGGPGVPGTLPQARRAGGLNPALGQTGRLDGAVDGQPDSDSQSDTPSLRLRVRVTEPGKSKIAVL